MRVSGNFITTCTLPFPVAESRTRFSFVLRGVSDVPVSSARRKEGVRSKQFLIMKTRRCVTRSAQGASRNGAERNDYTFSCDLICC